MMPRLRCMIVGCADPRVDPANIFGLEPGDAAVIRNIGGRITPATLQTMAMLRLVAGADPGGPPGPGWHLVVLHHTDCGINRLTAYPELLAAHFGIETSELGSRTSPIPAVGPGSGAAPKACTLAAAGSIVSGSVNASTRPCVEQVVGPELLRDETK